MGQYFTIGQMIRVYYGGKWYGGQVVSYSASDNTFDVAFDVKGQRTVETFGALELLSWQK